MADVKQILADPEFQGMHIEERRKVLLKVDSDFGSMAREEQDRVLNFRGGQPKQPAITGEQRQLMSGLNGGADAKISAPPDTVAGNINTMAVRIFPALSRADEAIRNFFGGVHPDPMLEAIAQGKRDTPWMNTPMFKATVLSDQIPNDLGKNIPRDLPANPEGYDVRAVLGDVKPFATGIAKTAENLTTPENLMILGLSAATANIPAVGRALSVAIGAGFDAMMVSQAIQSAPEIKKKLESGDAPGAIESAVELLAAGAMGAHGAKGKVDALRSQPGMTARPLERQNARLALEDATKLTPQQLEQRNRELMQEGSPAVADVQQVAHEDQLQDGAYSEQGRKAVRRKADELRQEMPRSAAMLDELARKKQQPAGRPGRESNTDNLSPEEIRRAGREEVAVPEDGPSMGEQQLADRMEQLAEGYGKKFEDLTPDEQDEVFDLAKRGFGNPETTRAKAREREAANTKAKDEQELAEEMDRLAGELGVKFEDLSPEDQRAVHQLALERRQKQTAAQGNAGNDTEPKQNPAASGNEPGPSTASSEGQEAAPSPASNSQEPDSSTSSLNDTPRMPKTPPVYGRQTEVLIPGEKKKHLGAYALREAEDVYASHNAHSFEGNPDYEYKNDRDYSQPQNAERIVRQTAEFDPAYLVNDNPTAENGPPIIDSRGNVLGGNSRAMTLERARRANPKLGESYREELRRNAKKLGLDPAAVDKLKNPVLVRELVDSGADPQTLITDLNKVGTAELRQAERAVADSRRVSTKSLEDLAGRIEEQGPEGTLAKALEGDARGIVDRLTEDGVLTVQERPRLMNGDGRLTAEGKQRVSRLMVGRLFEDARHFEDAAPELKAKLERVVPSVARMEGKGDWDIGDDVRSAVQLAEEARNRDVAIDDLTAQRGMFGDRNYSREAIAIAKLLRDGKPSEITKRFRQYANEAAMAEGGQGMLGMEPPTRAEAFDAAFGNEGSVAMARSRDSGSNIHDVINSRNTLYHATSADALLGIVEQKEITSRNLVNPDRAPHPLGDRSGVSTSRKAAVRSVFQGKVKREVTLILDRGAVPRTRSWVEVFPDQYTGKMTHQRYGKTRRYLGEEHSLAPSQKREIAALTEQRDAAERASRSAITQKSSATSEAEREALSKVIRQAERDWQTAVDRIAEIRDTRMARNFEFEERTKGEAVPLSAVRGLLIDPEAVADAAISAGEEPGARIKRVQEAAERAGIPYTLASGTDIENVRTRRPSPLTMFAHARADKATQAKIDRQVYRSGALSLVRPEEVRINYLKGKPTAAELEAGARFKYFEPKGDRPAVVSLNDQAMQVAGGILGYPRANGLTVPMRDSRYLRLELGKKIAKARGEQRAALERLGEAIAKAAEANAGENLVLVNGERGISRKELMTTVREELTHYEQFRMDEDSLRQANTSLATIMPQWKKIEGYLDRSGYSQEPEPRKVMEGAAQIAAGRWKDMGLTAQEAVEWFGYYIEAAKAKHGDKAERVTRWATKEIREGYAEWQETRKRNTNASGQGGEPQGPGNRGNPQGGGGGSAASRDRGEGGVRDPEGRLAGGQAGVRAGERGAAGADAGGVARAGRDANRQAERSRLRAVRGDGEGGGGERPGQADAVDGRGSGSEGIRYDVGELPADQRARRAKGNTLALKRPERRVADLSKDHDLDQNDQQIDTLVYEKFKDRPEIVGVNFQGMRTIGTLTKAGHFDGLTLDREAVLDLSSKLLDAAANSTPGARRKLIQLEDAISNSLRTNGGNAVVVVRGDAGIKAKSIMRAVREELTHFEQFSLGMPYETQVNSEGLMSRPEWAKVERYFRGTAYENITPHEKVIEGAAKIARGLWDPMGMSKAEAEEWLSAYVGELRSKFGDDALRVLRWAKKEFKTDEFIERTNPRDAVQRQRSAADGGRSPEESQGPGTRLRSEPAGQPGKTGGGGDEGRRSVSGRVQEAISGQAKRGVAEYLREKQATSNNSKSVASRPQDSAGEALAGKSKVDQDNRSNLVGGDSNFVPVAARGSGVVQGSGKTQGKPRSSADGILQPNRESATGNDPQSRIDRGSRSVGENRTAQPDGARGNSTAGEQPTGDGGMGAPPSEARRNHENRGDYTTSPSYDQTRENFIERVGLEETTRNVVREGLDVWQKTHPERRVVSFEDIAEEAKAYDPRLILELDRKKAQDLLVTDGAMRFAARNAQHAIAREIGSLSDRLGKESVVGGERQRLERKREQLEADFQKLTDLLIPTRSQIGRMLAYENMMAEQSFDVTYWLQRAKKAQALPEGVALPDKDVEKIRTATEKGQAAEDAAVERVQKPKTPEQIEKQAADELAAEGIVKPEGAETPEETGAKPEAGKPAAKSRAERAKQAAKKAAAKPELSREEIVKRTRQALLDRLDRALIDLKTQKVEPVSPAERELWEQDAEVIVRRAKLANYRQELKERRDGPLTREKEVERKRQEFIARLEARAKGKTVEVNPVKPEERALWENDPKVLELRAEIARKFPPKPEPSLADRQEHYRKLLMDRIERLTKNEAKAKKASKWELTPEQRKQVENDPQVRTAARELARIMKEQRKDGWLTYIQSLRSAGLLSAPGTHIRNMASNAAFQIFNEASRPMAMVADFALQHFSKKSLKQRTVQGISIDGMLQAGREGAVKGWADAKEIMNTGEVRNGDTKLFDFTRELNAKHLFENRAGLKHLAWTNDAINLVFRSLKAEDRFFKQSAYKRSLIEQMEMAKVKVPTEEMMLQAWADADFMTFNNENLAAKKLNQALAGLEKSGDAGKAGAAIVKFFLPFRNTPANVWMRGFEGMGGGVVTGAWKAMRAEGMLTAAQQRAISMEIGRGATGMGLVALGFIGAKNGWINGMIPDDERGQRGVAQAAGKQEGSIKVAGKWISITGLSPIANVVLVGATLARRFDDPLAFVSNADESLSLFNATVKDQPMLRGLNDMIEAFQNKGNRASSIVSSAAGSMVPSIANAAGQVTDSKRRDARGGNMIERAGKAMMARTPGLRQMLPERLDVMGRPLEQSRIGATLGFPVETESKNPVLQEMVRVGVGMAEGKPREGESKANYETRLVASRKAGLGIPERLPKESNEDFAARQAAIGDSILKRVERLMQSPKYQEMDLVEQQHAIEEQISKARKRAAMAVKLRGYKDVPAKEKRAWLGERMGR